MNRVKLSITNEAGQTLCKIGTSVPGPKGNEYTDQEIVELLRELSNLLSAKTEQDLYFDSSRVDEEDEKQKQLIKKWSWLFDGTHNASSKAMLIESQETPYNEV